MFPSKTEIRKAVDELFKLYEPMKRGEMLPHDEIAKVLGVAPNVHPWAYVIARLARRMEDERGISLVCVINEGYALATQDQQIKLGPRGLRRMARQAARTCRSVDSLPPDELTFHQQRVKAAMVQKLAGLETSIRQEARLQSFLMRPREGHPRIARPDEDDGIAGQIAS